MEFKELFRQARRQYMLTQAEMAEKLEVSQKTVQQIETGRRNPSAVLALKFDDVISGRTPGSYRWSGDNLYILRKKNQFTQKHLADAVGTDVSRISRWESGTEPELHNLERLCTILNCQKKELIEDAG